MELNRKPEEVRKIDYVFESEKRRNIGDFEYNTGNKILDTIDKIEYLSRKFKSLKNYDLYEKREEIEK